MPRLAAFMLRSRLVTLLGSIALVALFASQAAAGPSFVYALQQVTENVSQIHGFRLDLVSGALTPLPGFPVATGGKGGGGVKSEAMAHANGRLYVINNESDTLSAFSVNRTTGALTALPFSPIVLGAGWWDCVAVHPSGSPVVAGNAEGGLSSFVITATTATAAAGSPFATGGALPYSCAFSRDGSVVYTGGDLELSSHRGIQRGRGHRGAHPAPRFAVRFRRRRPQGLRNRQERPALRGDVCHRSSQGVHDRGRCAHCCDR